MSKVFDAYYFSAANNYGCDETYRQRQDEDEKINAAWEIHEAGEDLKRGIVDNVPEFVWMENTAIAGGLSAPATPAPGTISV